MVSKTHPRSSQPLSTAFRMIALGEKSTNTQENNERNGAKTHQKAKQVHESGSRAMSIQKEIVTDLASRKHVLGPLVRYTV